MPKGLVFNASLNRYDGGVYTSALSYNDMWCAWQHAWQAALKHTPQPVVDVNQQLVEALQAVLDCGSTSDQWWIDKAREALLSAGKGDDE